MIQSPAEFAHQNWQLKQGYSTGGREMDENEDRLRESKASLKRAANRKQGLALRRGEEIIGLEEFVKRALVPGRKWTINGGHLSRKTSRAKGGMDNYTSCQVHSLTIAETPEGNELNFAQRWSWDRDPRKPFLSIKNPESYAYTSRGKKHLSIRYTEGEFAGFTALTLTDGKTVEEERAEEKRIADAAFALRIRKEGEVKAKEHEAKLQKFFDDTPLRLELSGYSYTNPSYNYNLEYSTFGYRLEPYRYILHRTDTGERVEISASNLRLFIRDPKKE